MNFLTTLDVLSGGLSAERARMDITASNMANINTTRAKDGGPYKRLDPVFAAQNIAGMTSANSFEEHMQTVRVAEIVEDERAPRLVYQPNHPDADADGMVSFPNINMLEEMTNMVTSSRAYQAGMTCMQGVIEMCDRTLSLGK